MQQTLNDLFSGYDTGELNRNDLEGLVYKFLINNQEKTCLSHWKNDEYEDFISWFYPRLRLAIDSYNETGSSFEAFIAKYLLISSKEYHVRTIINSITEYSTWSARIPEMYLHEEKPVYSYKENKNIINKLLIDNKGRKNTKRLLALILKCYYYISDDFAEKIAPIIGIEINDLKDKLNKVRNIRQKKDDEIYYKKENIYRQYYRCIIYEKRLSLVKENTTAYEKLKIQYIKAKQRLERMRKRMMIVRTEATNQQVADVIGITKGTVDASLSRLKSKWEKMAEKADLN